MASPPALPHALERLKSFLGAHRITAGIVAAAAAFALLTAAVLPSMAAADVKPSPAPSTVTPTTSGQDTVIDDAQSAAPAPVKPKKPKTPKPASATHKAKNVPAFPRDRKHHGKRIVYDKALMTVWLINKRDEVVAQYPVVGRFDRPAKGVYRVFSKSPVAYNPNSKVTFNHMVRFTYGPDTMSPIGLHAIPKYYDGKPMHSVKDLGLAIARGGCVRLSEKAAAAVYKFAKVGDRVVVLPSP